MNNHWRSKIYEPKDIYANEPGDLGPRSTEMLAAWLFMLRLFVFACALAGLWTGFVFAEWWLS